MYLQNLVQHNGSRYVQCLITVWKSFFSPCSSVCNLHCNRLKLVSCIKLCLWLNLGFSPVTPHLWMTHNKQGHQKNIVYIFIQICRVFVSNFFTALLHSSLPCNESYCICPHTWQEEWLCIERELNAKQIERVSPAINLLRAELLYLAVILCQPLGHFWYYDFLPPCKHQVLLNGYSGLGAELDLLGTGSKRGSASWGTQGLFFFWALTASSDSWRQPRHRAFKKKCQALNCLLLLLLHDCFDSFPDVWQHRGSSIGCPVSSGVFMVARLQGRGKMLEPKRWVLVFHLFLSLNVFLGE